MTDRLKTELWVQSCIRRAAIDGVAVTVVSKGDPGSGAVLVKLNQRDKGCVVFAETRDPKGVRAWFRGTGADPVTEQAADEYIGRHRGRDYDLWVIEVDDRRGRLPFDDKILT